MVFVSPDLPAGVSARETRPVGYAFALPRLVARLGGRKVRRARLSRWEAYGTGILVFGLSCAFAGRLVLPLVRPAFFQLLALLVLPFAMWVAWLLLYYVNSLIIAFFRKLGLYCALTNNPFQHVVIISLSTLLAALLVRDETGWMQLLGAFWMTLVALNLLSIVVLKILDEA
jgi:hypothetical protein